MEDNVLISSAEKTMRKAGIITENKTAPALPQKKEENKKTSLEKLNEQLSVMLTSFQDNKYTQVNFKTTPLEKREFFENLNNPYAFPPYEGKPNVALNAVAGTVSSYLIFKVTEGYARSGILGYPTTVGNWLNFEMNSTVPLSNYNAYTNPNSKLSKSDLGTVAGACMVTNTIVGDAIFDSINKMPPEAQPLMKAMGFCSYLPMLISLADKGHPYGIINSVAGGLNVSPDSLSLFTLANLLLRLNKKGNFTAGSYTLNGNHYTGVIWKF